MIKLSILCVTQAQPYAAPFIGHMARLADMLLAEVIVGVDGGSVSLVEDVIEGHKPRMAIVKVLPVVSEGFLESVLDEMVAECSGDYILRLDDDECCSPAMVEWLISGGYLTHDHWCFPRMHIWPAPGSVLLVPQLWPDYQTRLSVKAKSGGRSTLHAMSPFGMGEVAPVAIEHHKFLVRTREEREETSRRWHSGGMTAFSLPEDVLTTVKVVDQGTGAVPWVPCRVEEVEMARA